MIWFAPVAVLGAWGLWRRREEPLAAACLLAFAALLVLYGAARGSANEYGTRYLVPALPLLVGGLGALSGRVVRVAVVLAVAGCVLHAPTLVAPFQRDVVEQQEAGRELKVVYWDLWTTPLITMWPTAVRQVRDARATDPADLVSSVDGAVESGSAGRESFRVVTQWWWLLPAVGVPRWIGALASAAAVLGGALLLRREARHRGDSRGQCAAIGASKPGSLSNTSMRARSSGSSGTSSGST
jgi:hypothetical protein